MATETERFAQLMRAIKERSGRSYGTLAKRLHSSTSTLHRYCSGAAVPADYAPVERFARVCGASADELVALHRQWLLALVERRRGVTEGQTPGAGAANSAAAPGGDAAPGVPSASAAGAVAGGRAAEAETDAETGPAPAPESASGSAPESASRSAPAPGPAVEAAASAIGPVVEAPAPAPGPAVEAAASAIGPVVEAPAPAPGPAVEAPAPATGPAVKAPAPAPVPAPSPEPAEAPAPALAPAPGAAPATEAAGPAPETEAAADAPAALIRPGSVPGAWRPRLLLAVAAAVATAVVAGTAAAVSALGDSGPGDPRHGAVEPSSRERAAAGPALPSGGSSSPADSAPPTGPGPSSPSATSASTSPAGDKKGASPTAPFTVNVRPDNWDSPCDQWFALDKAPGTVPPPPAGQATEGWARALDAVPAGHLRMQLTVQGTEGKPAVLHALYVHVVSGRKAPGWNAYTMGAGCGGALVPASFAVDLDDASPRARPVPGKEGERPTASTDFPYKVSSTDPQVLNIDAATLGQDVSWYLELAWSSGDRQGTTRIDDHGRPFRTVALNTGHRYWYNGNNNAWLPDTE
ncbi:helix-turn-helix domain-containing protein [Streptomyces sp. NPDC001591]|uniref:helix-turn-helix domain-containing protein n=1 Tax=Streptomyces sp. NPDC001591 TaxID=3364589 RepID=UPI003688F480